MNKEEIYAFLDAKGITYEVMNHKAVYNMAEAAELDRPHPEGEAKNLFVRDDKKRQYYLITVKGEKRVDLKQFGKEQGTRRLSFASSENLMEILHLIPGAVTPLGLLNDENRRVIFFLDQELLGGLIGCHPNDNTATVWLQTQNLVSIIKEHGNTVHVVNIS